MMYITALSRVTYMIYLQCVTTSLLIINICKTLAIKNYSSSTTQHLSPPAFRHDIVLLNSPAIHQLLYNGIFFSPYVTVAPLASTSSSHHSGVMPCCARSNRMRDIWSRCDLVKRPEGARSSYFNGDLFLCCLF